MTDLEKKHILIIIKYYGNNQNAKYIKSHHREEYQTLLRLTSFIPEKVNARRRIWHAENNIWYIPKCIHCSESAAYTDKIKGYHECCMKCFWIYRPDRKKAKITMTERYGVPYSFQSEELKNKSYITLKERYNVDRTAHIPNHSDKVKKIMIEKYGVDNYSKSEMKNMKNNNFHKIYDAGKIKFIKN